MKSLSKSLLLPLPLPPPTQISVDPKRLYQRQVLTLFKLATNTVAFSYVGVIISMAVMLRSNGQSAALYWFAFATLVTMFRAAVIWRFAHHPDSSHLDSSALPIPKARRWAQLLVAGNFLAGIQWALLGTVLFAVTDVHGQLFITMVIICYVAGSIVPFAPLKWAHPALAIPATVPTLIYIFFIHTGPQWLPGMMALFFIFTVIYFSFKQHQAVVHRLSLELQNEALVEKLNSNNDELGAQNNQLKHRSAVVKRAQLDQRRRAQILSSHVERTLLPVIECDRHFGIVTWNEAASNLLGYRIDEVCGKNLGKLFFPIERQGNIESFLERLFQDERASLIDMFLVTRNNQRIPVRFYVTPIFADDRTPLQIAVIITESYSESPNQGYRIASRSTNTI